MKLNAFNKTLLFVTVFFTVLILIVFAGEGFFLREREAARAARSLGFYWILLCAVFVAAAHIRRHYKEALLIACATGAALIIVEYALRFFLPYTALPAAVTIPSKTFHHIMPSDKTMCQVVGKEIIYVRSNSDGLRTKYSREEFLTYKDRIVVLGDSFMWGPGVQQEATCPEALERILRQRCGRESIAVLNAGMSSFSPFLEKILFAQKLVHYRPTLVLLFLDVTDIGDDIIYAQKAALDDSNQLFFDVPERGGGRYYGAIWEVLKPYMNWTDPLLEAARYPLELYALLQGRGNRRVPDYKPFDYYRFQVTIDDVVEKKQIFYLPAPA